MKGEKLHVFFNMEEFDSIEKWALPDSPKKKTKQMHMLGRGGKTSQLGEKPFVPKSMHGQRKKKNLTTTTTTSSCSFLLGQLFSPHTFPTPLPVR